MKNYAFRALWVAACIFWVEPHNVSSAPPQGEPTVTVAGEVMARNVENGRLTLHISLSFKNKGPQKILLPSSRTNQFFSVQPMDSTGGKLDYENPPLIQFGDLKMEDFIVLSAAGKKSDQISFSIRKDGARYEITYGFSTYYSIDPKIAVNVVLLPIPDGTSVGLVREPVDIRTLFNGVILKEKVVCEPIHIDIQKEWENANRDNKREPASGDKKEKPPLK